MSALAGSGSAAGAVDKERGSTSTPGSAPSTPGASLFTGSPGPLAPSPGLQGSPAGPLDHQYWARYLDQLQDYDMRS